MDRLEIRSGVWTCPWKRESLSYLAVKWLNETGNDVRSVDTEFLKIRFGVI